jgi:hypothetical protein
LTGAYWTIFASAGNFLSFNQMDGGLVFLPFTQLGGIFLGGTLLGFTGSFASLKRFITI